MIRPPLWLRATFDSCRSAVVSRLALAGVAFLCSAGIAHAGGVPINIDGDLQDMIDYANSISVPSQGCAFVDPDPGQDVRIFDPKIVPCVTVVDNYYVNGFDQVLDVLAYDRSAQVLLLGVRVAGVIGDPDGNGNPDTKCPEATFDDETGIGSDDSYKWDLNLDCAGAAEITIEVRNNQLTVTGVSPSFSDFAFNGSDLEVIISGVVLPPAYDVRVFAGNIADGLGEDLHELSCQPPGPQIAVDKTASPELICPGANTTFTVVVSNPGVVELQQVTLVDDLPAGLSYVAGSASNNCGVGDPSVVGQQITWPNIALAPGASCTFTFQAQAGAQCLGPQNNVATATGSFATPCFQAGEPQTVQASDDATVTCAPPPCVEITELTGPPSACANAPVTINGTVRNCSPEAETIVVSLVGGNSVNLGSVAAGQSVSFSLTGNMGECTPGENVTFTVNAVATNDCGTDDAQASVQVLCLAPPCIEISAFKVPLEACQNTSVTIEIAVRNCGTEPAEVTISLNGTPRGNASLAGGATATFTFTEDMGECTAGQSVPFTATAVATNSCGTDEATETRNVLCKVGPCVKLELRCEPAAACPGAPVTLTATATNCSVDAETIVITAGGSSSTVANIAPGGTAQFTVVTVMPDCTDGELVPFTASAVATNDCGEARDEASCSIECQTPEIDIEKSAEATVDVGGTIHYTITLTNPSESVTLEDIEVCDDLCAEATYAGNASPTPASEPAVGSAGGTICWNVASLAPGASLTFTFEAIAVGGGAECTEDVTCTNTVRARGSCSDAQATDSDEFATVIPCVEEGLCRLTGGGTLNEAGDHRGHKQHSFGGNVSPCPTGQGPTGDSWEHVVREGREILFNFHSWEPCITACSVVPPGPCSPNHGDITRADFSGPGRYSEGAGSRERDAYFEAVIIDHNEGHCSNMRDEYAITVWDEETDLIVFQFTLQETDTGNLQIHQTPQRLFGAPVVLPTPDVDGIEAVALLNRPYPNPFAASMSFGYEVPSGDAQAVEIGVYNVAGRLITRLASEVQGPGRYTVRWDGRDATGVQMAPGVYFLKSRVGQAESVSRLLKIAQ